MTSWIVVGPGMTNEEARMWALVKSGNDRVAVLSRGECEAVMVLLRLLSSGDGEGSDVAYHLAEVLDHRLGQPEDVVPQLVG